MLPGDLLEDPLEAGLRKDVERGRARAFRRVDAEALATRLDLVLRFLAGTVEHRPDGPGEMCRRLQEERGLPDPRLPAEQHQRTRHHTAAQDAIELGDTGRDPLGDNGIDVRVQLRSRGCRQAVSRCSRRSWSCALRHLPFLDERVPGAALGAASQPLGGLRAALLAGEDSSGFHSTQQALSA
jgi:hypothetical protein